MPEIRDIMPAFELMGLEARLAWELLLGSGSEATLREPEASYGDPDRLDMLSAHSHSFFHKVRKAEAQQKTDSSLNQFGNVERIVTGYVGKLILQQLG